MFYINIFKFGITYLIYCFLSFSKDVKVVEKLHQYAKQASVFFYVTIILWYYMYVIHYSLSFIQY